MKCVICDKELEAVECSDTQPYAGGYIKMTFTYGSTKFDNAIGTTEFDGYVCDSCAESLAPKMTESRFGMNGEKLEGGDFQRGAKKPNAQEIHMIKDAILGYELGEKDGSPFIKCKRCHRTSFNPGDVEQKYCGHCRKFHDR